MDKTHVVIREITHPIRHNNFEARRRKLGLSRVALGRILDVDPTTVFRHERGPMVTLWDWALRGIEAEAASKPARTVIRNYKSQLDLETFIPEQIAARGYSYVAEKMHEARQEHAKKRGASQRPSATSASHAGEPRRPKGELSKSRIKEIADRAEKPR